MRPYPAIVRASLAIALLFFLLAPTEIRAAERTKSHVDPNLRESSISSDLPQVREKPREATVYQQILDLGDEANVDFQRGDDAQAESLYKKAIDIAEKALPHDSPVLAGLLGGLGNVYYHRRDDAQAESLYKKAIDIAEKTLLNDSPVLATLLLNLGNVYRRQTKPAEAEPLYRRAVLIEEKAQGGESADLLTFLEDLAVVCDQQGKYSDAEILYLRAIRIAEKALPTRSEEFAGLLDSLASVYYHDEKYAAAEPLDKRALEIGQKILPPDSPNLATLSYNLANIYYREGKYSDAIPQIQRAIKIVESVNGAQTPELATDLNNLAAIYLEQGKYADAERFYQRAIKIDEKALADSDPHLARDLNNLASLYVEQLKYVEAEPLYERALKIRETTLGPDNPDVAETLNNLAALYDDEGRFDDAESRYRRVLEIDRVALGPSDPRLARDLNNLGTLYEHQLKYEEAEKLTREALDIDERALGPEHPAVAGLLNNLALLCDDERKYDDAEQLYRRALKIAESTFGSEHPNTAATLYNLAMLYYTWGKPNEADEFFDRAAHADSRVLDDQFFYMTEDEQLQFLEAARFHALAYIDFAIQYSKSRPELGGEIFNLLLWQKGIVARTNSSRRATVEASGDQKALALLDEIARKDAQMVRVLAAVSSDTKEQHNELAEYSKLNEEKHALERDLAQRSSAFARPTRTSQINWQEVRDKLQPHEVAIEFVRSEFADTHGLNYRVRYAALVVTAETKTFPTLVVLGDANSLECEPMNDYARTAGFTRMPCKVRQPDGSYRFSTTPTFYDAFWRRLEPVLGDARRVYFAPDGVLNEVSLGVVADTDGQRLVDKYDLRMLNSTRDVLREPQKYPENTAVLVGAPLFELDHPRQLAAAQVVAHSQPRERSGGALSGGYGLDTLRGPVFDASNQDEKEIEDAMRTEVRELNTFLRGRGWSTALYTDEKAVVEVVKGVHHPRVLHIATHGEFAEDPKPIQNPAESLGTGRPALLDDPMLRSALFFAGANRFRKRQPPPKGMDNGILTAFEATGLDLHGTELVVLSACDTGLGSIRNGEGVFGLRRALQEAGADVVLMSMWEVPSKETEELMRFFYEKWLSGETKVQALKEAQLELRTRLRQENGDDDPHLWGAFVLVGD